MRTKKCELCVLFFGINLKLLEFTHKTTIKITKAELLFYNYYCGFFVLKYHL